MPWFKLDDGFHCHPKVLQAGNEAAGLYVRCGSYCAQHLTDGFVPATVVMLYGTAELADRLVRAKLWRPVEGGWRMHDYLTYNPSREQVQADRGSAAERQRRAREKRSSDLAERNGHAVTEPVSHAVSHAVTHAEVTPSVTPLVTRPRPDPTRPTPSTEQTASLAPLASAPTAENFEEFYAAYPRREDRRAAERAYRAARKRGVSPAVLLQAAKRYAESKRGVERKFIKLPSSWLNAGAYDNELPADDDPAVTGERRVQL